MADYLIELASGLTRFSYSIETLNLVHRNLNIYFRYDEQPPKDGDLELALSDRLTVMENEFAELQENHPDDWFEEIYRMYKDRTNWFNYTDGKSNLIING